MTVLTVTLSHSGTLELDVPVFFNWGATYGQGHYLSNAEAVGMPYGLELDLGSGEVAGTPTVAGSGVAQVTVTDSASHTLTVDWPWSVLGPLTAPTGLAATPTTDTLEVTWDESPGATGYVLEYRQTGVTEWSTTATATPGATLEDLTPATGYELRVSATDATTTTDPSPVVTVTTLPEDGPPDPEPGDMPADLEALTIALAPVLAAYLGRPGDPSTVALATAQLPVVVEFVRQYTRSREWTGYTPPYPLRSVIVSATARLVSNPDQVSQYAAADYSERPAVLNGYTLAELGVLRRYRKGQA